MLQSRGTLRALCYEKLDTFSKIWLYEISRIDKFIEIGKIDGCQELEDRI